MKQKETPGAVRARVARGREVLKKMKTLFPGVAMALTYGTHWELLVAVQLSAQCTDKKVNEVTPKLFARYRTLDEYADADPVEFEKYIYQTGFYRSKTKHILGAAKMIKERFSGRVPKTMDEILLLPGVARKTANVVLGNAFGVVEGIAVDTHVRRLSRLFALTDEIDPKKIERDLMDIYSKKDWFTLTYYMIEYGRVYCPARKHDGRRCPIPHGDSMRSAQ